MRAGGQSLFLGNLELSLGAVDGVLAGSDRGLVVGGHRLSQLESFLRGGGGNVFGEGGTLGEDGHIVVEHLGESTINEKLLRAGTGFDAEDPGAEFAKQGGAVVQDADEAVVGRKDDLGGLGVEDLVFGGNDGAMQSRYSHASFLGDKREYVKLGRPGEAAINWGPHGDAARPNPKG